MYAKGNGVKQNPATALAWFRKAAERGYPDSQARLGLLYRKGISVKPDKVEAFMWYSLAAANPKAAAKARKNARKYRAQLAKTMSPGDLSKAKQRFKEFRAK
jgi:TPR repeat protein